MKRFLLRTLAALTYPLVLLISYEELHHAYRFANSDKLERGEVPDQDLFDWYLDDFTTVV